jgi:hypothetical protein
MRTGLYDIEALVREPARVGRRGARLAFLRSDRRHGLELADAQAVARRRKTRDDVGAAEQRTRR